jgi:transcriptional regulator with XRE-family HTH domain
MATELSLALLILRTIRGWKQHDLARAAQVRDNSVSEYENGRRVPDQETLRHLVEAMGYSLATLDRARHLVGLARSEGKRTRAPETTGAAPEAAAEPGTGAPQSRPAAALQEEIDRLAAEMASFAARLNAVLHELSRRSTPPS